MTAKLDVGCSDPSENSEVTTTRFVHTFRSRMSGIVIRVHAYPYTRSEPVPARKDGKIFKGARRDESVVASVCIHRDKLFANNFIVR